MSENVNNFGEPLGYQGGIVYMADGTQLVYPRKREVDCVNALAGVADPKAAITASLEAIRQAIQLCDIADDWNLPEIEIDGKMVCIQNVKKSLGKVLTILGGNQ